MSTIKITTTIDRNDLDHDQDHVGEFGFSGKFAFCSISTSVIGRFRILWTFYTSKALDGRPQSDFDLFIPLLTRYVSFHVVSGWLVILAYGNQYSLERNYVVFLPPWYCRPNRNKLPYVFSGQYCLSKRSIPYFLSNSSGDYFGPFIHVHYLTVFASIQSIIQDTWWEYEECRWWTLSIGR